MLFITLPSQPDFPNRFRCESSLHYAPLFNPKHQNLFSNTPWFGLTVVSQSIFMPVSLFLYFELASLSLHFTFTYFPLRHDPWGFSHQCVSTLLGVMQPTTIGNPHNKPPLPHVWICKCPALLKKKIIIIFSNVYRASHIFSHSVVYQQKAKSTHNN